jgi:HSP20 family molecular chaperone IbpA
MPFYNNRSPLESLFYDPFFTSFWEPRHHNVPRGSSLRREEEEPIRAFSPNFDVHETEKEYILEGELPGLDNVDNIHLEFADANTLVIRGKIERSHTAGTPPERLVEGQQKPAITEGEKKEGEHQKKEEKGTKYWVQERTVGVFQRSFSFPGEIDHDNVTASLANGILKIIVSKKEKRGVRRIPIKIEGRHPQQLQQEQQPKAT